MGEAFQSVRSLSFIFSVYELFEKITDSMLPEKFSLSRVNECYTCYYLMVYVRIHLVVAVVAIVRLLKETFIFNMVCCIFGGVPRFIRNQLLLLHVAYYVRSFCKTFPFVHFRFCTAWLIDCALKILSKQKNITNWLSLNMTHVSNYKNLFQKLMRWWGKRIILMIHKCSWVMVRTCLSLLLNLLIQSPRTHQVSRDKFWLPPTIQSGSVKNIFFEWIKRGECLELLMC